MLRAVPDPSGKSHEVMAAKSYSVPSEPWLDRSQ